MAIGDAAAQAEALVPLFMLDRVLNQDQAGRRISLLGRIKQIPAIMIIERAPFPSTCSQLITIPTTLRSLKNLGANDIYHWYMAASGTTHEDLDDDIHEDLKINLIYPCTDKHVKKYSKQGVRWVTETPEIYREHVRPYMERQRGEGRLQWVYNIIEGKTEVEDVIYRTPYLSQPETGFLLIPDLNWDRKTLSSLHLLAIVERRDIWSVRDLRKKHIGWLRDMQERIIEATVKSYPAVERDQLKAYVHYQPTYYHFHVHVVHVQLEAGTTQAVGKAWGLEAIIEQLGSMEGDEEKGMDCVTVGYTLGEASELWTGVFEPLKKKALEAPVAAGTEEREH